VNTWYFAHLFLIQSTLITLLLATSVQVQLRVGVFSFAGIGSYGIGTYTTAILTTRYGWGAPLAILAGVVIAAVVGYLFSFLVARLGGLYLGMCTIVFDLILSVLAVNGGSFTGGSQGLFGILNGLRTWALFVIVVLVLVGLSLSERGRLGRRTEAVREDPELALAMGIKVTSIRRLSFAVSGALGACAGGMNALVRTTVSPADIGFQLVVLTLTIIIVGGAGSWLGAFIGAIVFTWLPVVLTGLGDWQNIVYGAIVALAAIWVPGGLVAVVRDAFRSLQRRSAARQAIAAEDTPYAVDDELAGELAALEEEPGRVQ
jgi:branched-chain amino acid transport system permease protein